jgi:hypothetical protein
MVYLGRDEGPGLSKGVAACGKTTSLERWPTRSSGARAGFKLATLNALAPAPEPGFEPWWHSMFEQWALTLDIVIWLPHRIRWSNASMRVINGTLSRQVERA